MKLRRRLKRQQKTLKELVKLSDETSGVITFQVRGNGANVTVEFGDPDFAQAAIASMCAGLEQSIELLKRVIKENQ